MNKTERNRLETALYFLCFELRKKYASYDTEWNYKHLVITVAVHKMDFEAVELK